MVSGTGRGRPFVLRSLFALTLLFAVLPTGAHGPAPDAAALLGRMEKQYQNAKTFQAALVLHRSGKTEKGKAFTVSMNQQIRYKSPNLFYVQEQYAGTGEAANIAQTSQTKVCDGKSFYLYVPAQKKFAKQKAPADVPLVRILAYYMPNPARFTMNIGKPVKVEGHDAYVILAQPKIPTDFRPGITPEQKAAIVKQIKEAKPTQIFIDKQNYQLLRLIGGTPDNREDMTFTSQTLDGSLPSHSFAFHPPADAHDVSETQKRGKFRP